MTIANEQQTNLLRDFLSLFDGRRSPDIIISTGLERGEMLGKGRWAVLRELNDNSPETIIRMMDHTGTAVEVPSGAMADHATQSTPHIHLGTQMQAASFVNVTTSDEGNIAVNFFDVDGSPSFAAFKLRGNSHGDAAWQDKLVTLGERAVRINEISRGGTGTLLEAQTNFFAKLFEDPETVLFTGLPHRIAQITSARVGASWGLVQERVNGVPEYFIRLRGEYLPLTQNSSGEMQGGLHVHQTLHSQHVHVVWESLARPVLTVGVPNGEEAILTFNGKGQRAKSGRFTPTPALRLFNTVGMAPAEIAELLQKHRGYLIDGRAK